MSEDNPSPFFCAEVKEEVTSDIEEEEDDGVASDVQLLTTVASLLKRGPVLPCPMETRESFGEGLQNLAGKLTTRWNKLAKRCKMLEEKCKRKDQELNKVRDEHAEEMARMRAAESRWKSGRVAPAAVPTEQEDRAVTVKKEVPDAPAPSDDGEEETAISVHSGTRHSSPTYGNTGREGPHEADGTSNKNHLHCASVGTVGEDRENGEEDLTGTTSSNTPNLPVQRSPPLPLVSMEVQEITEGEEVNAEERKKEETESQPEEQSKSYNLRQRPFNRLIGEDVEEESIVRQVSSEQDTKKVIHENSSSSERCHIRQGNQKNLNRIVKNVNGKGIKTARVSCDVCQKTFVDKTTLTRHAQLHTETRTRSFKCEICGRAFYSSGVYTKHLRTHDPKRIRDYKCPTCSKAFYTSTHLVQHEVVHQTDKPFKCPQCQHQFKRKDDCSKHLKEVHSEGRPFKCIFCDKAFKRSRDFENHTRIHTGERPYPCQICNQTFMESGALSLHKRTHQGEDGKIHQCPFCSMKYMRKFDCMRHQQRHHKSEFLSSAQLEMGKTASQLNTKQTAQSGSANVGSTSQHQRQKSGKMSLSRMPQEAE